MKKGIQRIFLASVAFSLLELPTAAQLPFLKLDQATVDTSASTFELMVQNPQSLDVSLASFHLTVIKQKVFLNNLEVSNGYYVTGGTLTTVLADVDLVAAAPQLTVLKELTSTPGRFLSGLNPVRAPRVAGVQATATLLSLLREAPAPTMTRSRILPPLVKNVTTLPGVCSPCGQVFRGATPTYTGSADEDALWRVFDFLQSPQNGRHTHTRVTQSVLTSLTTTSATAIAGLPTTDAAGVRSLSAVTQIIPTSLAQTPARVFEELTKQPAVYVLGTEQAPIVYECPLVYNPERRVVAPGDPATITVSLRDFSGGDAACLPAPGDRVIIQAYDDVGGRVLQAMKTAQ